MDSTTTPTGRWADLYAPRVAAMASLPRLDWADFTPEMAEAMAERDLPFGDPEATEAVTEDLEVPGPNGGIPVRVYRHASGETSGAGLVWCHGGAFLGGDLDMPEADLVARGLVTRTKAVVASVDYRLCHAGVHHPVPHDDAYAAFTWIRAHAADFGIDPARVAVGGASAGGNLAASVALHSRDAGAPAWQVLLAYPVVHVAMPEPSAELAACLAQMPPALRFEPPTVAWMNENYLGGPAETADAYAFAALAHDLTGYPTTYIENAEFDDLRASGEAFAARLADAGVDVTVVVAAGVPHGHLNAIGSPLTSATLDRFAARLNETSPNA